MSAIHSLATPSPFRHVGHSRRLRLFKQKGLDFSILNEVWDSIEMDHLLYLSHLLFLHMYQATTPPPMMDEASSDAARMNFSEFLIWVSVSWLARALFLDCAVAVCGEEWILYASLGQGRLVGRLLAWLKRNCWSSERILSSENPRLYWTRCSRISD